ncbi:MAG TPA: YbjN domain-containing protein [Polyangiales bacterium]|nr:YbjN domain-containing protein [Polyangiales bacterium]
MPHGQPIERINDYIRRFGSSVGADLHPLDATGYTDLRHGDLVIGVNAFLERDVLLILVRMCRVPDAHREALFRRLLELNFLATRSCSFAIDAERELVYLRAMRPLDGLDYEEFVDLLKTAAAVAGKLREKVPELEG